MKKIHLAVIALALAGVFFLGAGIYSLVEKTHSMDPLSAMVFVIFGPCLIAFSVVVFMNKNKIKNTTE